MFLKHLVCTNCGTEYDWSRLENLCPKCGKPLFAVYDLAAVGRVLTKEKLATRAKSLWRYREVLPLPNEVEPVSLGEGWTPLLPVLRWGSELGFSDLWVKTKRKTRPKVSRRAE